MSHILHLGHQVTDLAGVEGRISADAAGFDADLDVNCVRINTGETSAVPFSASWSLPTGDIWLSFRYKAPSINAHIIGTDGTFLELYDTANALVAIVRTERDDEKYHAMAVGDTSVDGASGRPGRSACSQYLGSGCGDADAKRSCLRAYRAGSGWR